MSTTKKNLRITPFDPVEHLRTEEDIAEYLAACLEEDDPDLFIAALGDVARARGMKKIADATGLGRESLYKALSPGSKVRHETVRKVLEALGVRLTVQAAQ
jgi:probable addiction module antidote protein